VDFARGAAREIGLQGGIALLMVSEHEAEEGVEEAVALGWLRRLGLQPYRLRVSGHYYPHEFARLVGLVKSREIVPVHTEEPGLMLRLFEKLSHRE
jgi:ribonuclease J